MKELTIEATRKNLSQVLGFVNSQLEECGCSRKARFQMDIAVEEIFVNIADYGYPGKTGMAIIRVDADDDPHYVTVTFRDHGVPFDPLAKPDPDITLPPETRPIGGLGVYMVKKSMDDVQYEYKDGDNIFRIKKSL